LLNIYKIVNAVEEFEKDMVVRFSVLFSAAWFLRTAV